MKPLLRAAGFVLASVAPVSCTTTTGDAPCPSLVKYDGKVYIGLSSDDAVPGKALGQATTILCESIEDGGDPKVMGKDVRVFQAGTHDPRDAVAVKQPVGWRTYELIRPHGPHTDFDDAAD